MSPDRHRGALPPGPEANVFAQTVAFHRRPLEFLRECRDQHGDVFTLRLLTARPLVVVADPDAAATLLEADPERAHAGSARRQILPFASERSVFGGDAERHRAARGRIAAALSAEAMAARRPAIAALAALHAGTWPRHRSFQLLSRMRTLCDEVFVRLVLGVRDDAVAAELAAAIGRMLRTPGNPPLTLPGPGDGAAGALGQRLFEWRQAGVVRALRRAIEVRRADPSAEDDVLGRMVAAQPRLGDEEIVEELMSLLMAAQEPPAIALTWLLDRLSREPQLAERFAADPDGELADSVVRETLRLNPPASGVLRRLTGPLRAGAHQLPAGVSVLVPSALLNRDPRGYAAPEEFRPERWRNGEPAAGVPFFPFGGGIRRCIGENLARTEIETVVPAVLAAVRLTPLAAVPEPIVQRATVLVPRRSLLVRAAETA